MTKTDNLNTQRNLFLASFPFFNSFPDFSLPSFIRRLVRNINWTFLAGWNCFFFMFDICLQSIPADCLFSYFFVILISRVFQFSSEQLLTFTAGSLLFNSFTASRSLARRDAYIFNLSSRLGGHWTSLRIGVGDTEEQRRDAGGGNSGGQRG